MRALAAALVLLAPGAGCASARNVPTLSVAEVVAQHRALDGRVIRVRGWIGTCHGRSCGLSGSLAQARGDDLRGSSLSIGWAPDFDRQVRSPAPVEVELEARLHAVCFNDPMPAGIVEVCADRVDQLRHPRLRRILSHATSN